MLVECLANNKFFEILSTAELYQVCLKPEFTPSSIRNLYEYFMRFKGSPSVVSTGGSSSLKNIFLQELGDEDFQSMSELHKQIKENRSGVPDLEFDFLKSYIDKNFQIADEHKSSNSNLNLLTVTHRYRIGKKKT
jgi:hypothetical protein